MPKLSWRERIAAEEPALAPLPPGPHEPHAHVPEQQSALATVLWFTNVMQICVIVQSECPCTRDDTSSVYTIVI